MTPDDPRHGTNAGFFAHTRAGQDPCQPCYEAKNRQLKQWRIYGSPTMTTLGERAWHIIDTSPPCALSEATGITPRILRTLRRGGPDARCRTTTRERILSTSPPTNVGITRRLQALAKLGYSAPMLAAQCELHPTVIVNRRLRPARHYVEARTISAVVALYDRLHMTPAPPSRVSAATRKLAERKGWLPPLAWDDIDDPGERPQVGQDAPRSHSDYDEAVVVRVVRGERLSMTRAERLEAVRRLRDDWGWSEERIETHTGISKSTNRDRYPTRPQEDAA